MEDVEKSLPRCLSVCSVVIVRSQCLYRLCGSFKNRCHAYWCGWACAVEASLVGEELVNTRSGVANLFKVMKYEQQTELCTLPRRCVL